MKVPLMDIEKLSAEVRTDSLAAMTRVYDRGDYILGSEVAAFEQEVAQLWSGACSCVGVSSGTDALVCALLSAGVTPGARVVTTPLTFFATISAILRVGATPLFCDVDEHTYNLAPHTYKPAPGAPLAAVIPVHLFGRAVDMSIVRAAFPGVAIVEDAAQALGAKAGGRSVGNMGDVAAVSFFPTKPLGGCGDGGLVVTSNPDLADRCRVLRSHGRTTEGTFAYASGNYRLDALQAALLRVRLKRFAEWQERRGQNARYYLEALSDLAGVGLPVADTPTSSSAWSVFSIRVPSVREQLRQHLTKHGITTAVYYPVSAHLQPALGQHVGTIGQYPVAERLSAELLALPIGPELASDQRGYVVDCVRSFFD